MRKITEILILTAAIMALCGCADRNRITLELKRQDDGVLEQAQLTDTDFKVCKDFKKTGKDTYNDLTAAYETMYAYIVDGRYLITYEDRDVNKMCVYDLDSLKDGAFLEYVVQYRHSFSFTDNMKAVYLKTAMKDASFQDKPYFTYYDEEGNVKLEIYFDESGTGCGICYDAYDYEYSGERKGFVFREYHETAWEEENPVLWFEPEEYFKAVESCKTGTYVELRNYEDEYEYNDAGQVTGFFAKGETDLFTDEWIPINIASYTCEYNKDGSKKKEELFRHSMLFGTSMSTADCHYDETGRITYIHSYITHGSLDYFFIYEDDGAVPAYGVVIDHNPGMDDGVLYRYVR